MYVLPLAYKLVIKDKDDVELYRQDLVPPVPATSVDLDIDGLAGVDLAANIPVYLGSDGRWRPSRADDTTSCLYAAIIGTTVTAIATGQRGPIRLSGRQTGFSGLTPGAPYYVASTGGITPVVTANSRRIGIADADGQSLVVQPKAAPATAGTHDLFLPALAFQPRTAGGPSGAHEHLVSGAADLIALPFPPTACVAFAIFRAPKSWDRGGIQADVMWTQKAGGTGNVVWYVYIDPFGAGSGLPAITKGNSTGDTPVGGTLVIQEKSLLGAAAPLPAAGQQHLCVSVVREVAASNYASPVYFLGLSLHLKTVADTDD